MRVTIFNMQNIFGKIARAPGIIRKRITNKFSLSDGGERIDIRYSPTNNFDAFDINQKSHFKRYEFARTLLKATEVVGDFGCGTGYGTCMLAEKAQRVIGGDINDHVVRSIQKRYRGITNIEFIVADITALPYQNFFDSIVSFETIEHLDESVAESAFKSFFQSLKPGGLFIFSTPFLQRNDANAARKGFHKIFDIDEKKIAAWLTRSGFDLESFLYQSNLTHVVTESNLQSDFIICIARKATAEK